MKFSVEKLRYENEDGEGLVTLDFLLSFFQLHVERWLGVKK